ncbi:MAG: bifunctional serine/threonine-protein kinase/formylglycine-generating enzyme family protein [Acidobacteriota bacterium]
MQPERWQQIKSLYEAVLKEPAQAQALLSGVDPQVRREVEALLASRVPDADATLTMANPAPPAVEQFGPYQVIAPIGKGGMGQVFKGLDTRLGRLVAIKTSQDRFNERFEREARAISSLNHPHICTLYDVGTTPSGAAYLVMELVEGETLAARLKRGKRTIEETLRCGAQIADALAAAHLKGIVHRDLKPANIMLAGGAAMHVKVLDFGLAKTAQDATLTAMNAVMGTPAYMAPEQAAGAEAAAAADLFALGLVLYEMASGKLPLPGKSLGASLLTATTPSSRLSSTLPDAPKAFDALIAMLLEKDPAKRPSSATVASQLSALAVGLHAPRTSAAEIWRRPAVLIPVTMAVLIAVLSGGWMYYRSQQQRWALEVAVPEIAKLRTENKPLEAYRLLLQAEEDLPGDANIEKTAAASTQFISVTSSSPGATVEIQDYLAPDAPWSTLGATPLEHLRIPKGYFRWKLSKPGTDPFISAPVTVDAMQFAFPPAAEAQSGMVSVPGGPWGGLIGFIGWIGFNLPAFDIDRYEVTNRDYQKFVDEGGYQKQDYWTERFLKDGQQLTWQQAMDLFRDPTGRPGPSTWDGGHFPQGQENYPVSGVSWYEASAYAAYAGKSLPALGEWYKAAPGETARFATNQSNFSGKPLAVGASQAVGAFGTDDLTGNVRQWCLNEVQGGERFILGGAWGTQI